MITLDALDIAIDLKPKFVTIIGHILLISAIVLLPLKIKYTPALVGLIAAISTEIYLLKRNITTRKAVKTMNYSIRCMPITKTEHHTSTLDMNDDYYLRFSENVSRKVSNREYLCAEVGDLYYIVFIDGTPRLFYNAKYYKLDDTLHSLLQ